MESKLVAEIPLRYEPVAIMFSDTLPEDAKRFKENRWGCVMFMFVAAMRGDTVVFDRKTFGCFGGGVGLGFGNQYKNFSGGEDGFCHFLSYGNERTEAGKAAAEAIRPHVNDQMYDHFLHGERYIMNPELVRDFIENLPIMDILHEYVVFKPLGKVDADKETPKVVVFSGDADEISALSILVNYGRKGNENVIFPYAAGCQTMGIYAFREAESETPRAVLGLSDISARLAVKRLLKDDVMTLAVPYSLFLEMEDHVVGSFIEKHNWKALLELKKAK